MDIEIKRKKLIKEISQIEAHVNYLNERKSNLISELNSLPYNTNSFTNNEYNKESFCLSVNEKLELFASLFKGRNDVYARLWTSKKTGKSGYSPVCKNEWIPKICQKRIIKCSECPNREFIPFNEYVIRKHLEGKEIIGIYPLLQNENCNFLAVDFDKEGWLDNVSSFKGRIVQYAGRLHRQSEGKEDVCIYDYLDHNVPVLLRMYKKRLKTYERIGYNINESFVK